ncbi:MAG: dTDP-4-dehydrorhamnose reductase [Pseudomonadota bacterium]
MKVLVTGRSGQLARSLAERAEGRVELVTMGRPELDLEEPGSAANAIAAARPDVVINAAAYTAVDEAEDEPERAMRINAEAAGEVAVAAAKLGVPVIQISTDYVFDGRGEGGYPEDAPTAPLGVYGRTKLAGEEAVRGANPRHVMVRTAWVYSPFGRNFVKTMMGAAKVREVLTVVDDQRGNPSSALDLADGLLAMVERWRDVPDLGLSQTYHLAGTGSTSWCGFARAVMAECAKLGLAAAKVQPIASADWPTKASRPHNSQLSSEKFVRDFGFVMPPWERSLTAVVARLAKDG